MDIRRAEQQLLVLISGDLPQACVMILLQGAGIVHYLGQIFQAQFAQTWGISHGKYSSSCCLTMVDKKPVLSSSIVQYSRLLAQFNSVLFRLSFQHNKHQHIVLFSPTIWVTII